MKEQEITWCSHVKLYTWSNTQYNACPAKKGGKKQLRNVKFWSSLQNCYGDFSYADIKLWIKHHLKLGEVGIWKSNYT